MFSIRKFATAAFCPYKTLKIPRNSSKKEIKQAFIKMAKETHPDLAGGKEAEFLKVRKAYDILTNKPGAAADQTDYSSSQRSRNSSSSQQQRYSFYQQSYGQSEYERRYARYRAGDQTAENPKLYGPHWRIVVGIAIVSAIAGMSLLNLFEIQRDKFMNDREAAFLEAEKHEQKALAARTKLPPKGEIWNGER